MFLGMASGYTQNKRKGTMEICLAVIYSSIEIKKREKLMIKYVFFHFEPLPLKRKTYLAYHLHATGQS